MWTISTETIEASGYSNKTIKTSALRSDDGALLVYQGANRDCAQLFDYRRGSSAFDCRAHNTTACSTRLASLLFTYRFSSSPSDDGTPGEANPPKQKLAV